MRDDLAHHTRQRLAGKTRERPPARADGRLTSGGYLGAVDDELERKVRECMRHHAGHTAPRGFEWRVFKCRCLLEIACPFARRHFGHAAEQAILEPRAREQKSIRAHHHKRRAAAQCASLLLGLAWKALLVAAFARRAWSYPRAQRTGRI